MVQGEAKLFLGQVTFDATKEDIIRLFSAYGDVIHVQLLWDHGRQSSRGAAFVTYGSTEEADTAIAALHDRYPTLPGRCLQVSYAKNSPNISAYGHHMAVDVATRNGSNPMPGMLPRQSTPPPPPPPPLPLSRQSPGTAYSGYYAEGTYETYGGYHQYGSYPNETPVPSYYPSQ